jgi:hypothetical protein
MQQRIHAGQGIGHPKLPTQNREGVFRPKGTDDIPFRGAGQHSLFEDLFVFGRQFDRPSRIGFGKKGSDAPVPIGIIPPLHKILAASQHVHDLRGCVTLQGQGDRAVAIPLFGVGLVAGFPEEFVSIPRPSLLYLHRHTLSVLPSMTSYSRSRKSYFRKREIFLETVLDQYHGTDELEGLGYP